MSNRQFTGLTESGWTVHNGHVGPTTTRTARFYSEGNPIGNLQIGQAASRKAKKEPSGWTNTEIKQPILHDHFYDPRPLLESTRFIIHYLV